MSIRRIPPATACLAMVAGSVIYVAPNRAGVSVALAAGEEPPVILVTGTVRDFQRAHPDFDVVPAGGYGHYAGNVALDLGAGDLPFLAGGGFKVAAQWMERDSHHIAPHLYQAAGDSSVSVVNAPNIIDEGVVDTYNPTAGPYGGTNVWPAPTFVTGSAMPDVSEPDLGANVGVVTLSGSGTTILSGQTHCDQFIVSNEHTVRVSGDVSILCEELFKIENEAVAVEFLPDATLTVYVKKDAIIQDEANVNLGDDPDRLVIYNLGTNDLIVQNEAQLSATVVSPNARLYLHNSAKFIGSFVGKSIHIQNEAGFHLGVPTPVDACGAAIEDTAGSKAGSGTGGITSATTFAQWFNDVLGTNLSTLRTISLTRNADGVYEYLDDDFHPIDDRLFGNEGESHNNYFTMTFSAEFTYQACTGQFVSFFGADDVWMFVDGKLGLDLEGVLPLTEQYLELDRLDLVDGETYEIEVFYAQRQPNGVFHLRTDIPLVTPVGGSISALYD